MEYEDSVRIQRWSRCVERFVIAECVFGIAQELDVGMRRGERVKV